MKRHFKIIFIFALLLLMGCKEDEVIVIDATKNSSPHQFHRLKKHNQSSVEIIRPKGMNAQKKRVTFNNRIDVVVNKYKLDNLNQEELQKYIKSLFTIYRQSALENFKQIPVTEFGENHIKFKSDKSFKNKFELTISSSKFNPEEHELEKHKGWYLYKIDGEAFLGTDGTPPTKQIENIELKINDNVIPFPKESYNDLYEPNFCKYFSEKGGAELCYIDALISSDYKYIFLLMEGGEAAGVYEVIWVFRLGQFHTRAINIPY